MNFFRYTALLLASTLMVVPTSWAEPIHSELSKMDFMLWGLSGPWITLGIVFFAALGIFSLAFAFIRFFRNKKAWKPLCAGSICLGLAVGLFIVQSWARSFPDILSDRPCGPSEASAALDKLPCVLNGALVSADSLQEYIENLCERNPEDGATQKGCHKCFEQAKKEGVEVLTTLIKFQMLEPISLDDFRDSMKFAEVNTCENSSP